MSLPQDDVYGKSRDEDRRQKCAQAVEQLRQEVFPHLRENTPQNKAARAMEGLRKQLFGRRR
ncbi:MAG TPA: hypothetical protein VH682_24620 [Gemmataceae bacterium]|jgi:hypothetical protein